MQLRSVRIHPVDEVPLLKIEAPLEQWITLLGLTTEEFQAEFNGDIFLLIKHMNSQAKGDFNVPPA